MTAATLASSMPSLVFFIVGAIAIASSIMVVSMRNPVHSALFLLLTFLCVAIVFILAEAEFVGAVQILVYAGGVMVLFLFVVMLINVRHLKDERMSSPFLLGGILVGVLIFALFASVFSKSDYLPMAASRDGLRTAPKVITEQVAGPQGPVTQRRTIARADGNSEAVAMELYSDYLVPFEVASLFLLVAMIGAIVIGKRELRSMDEDSSAEFIIRRVTEEKKVKEAAGA